MSFDGVVTRAVVHELKEKLVRGRITKIYQPTQSELILVVRHKGKNEQLLLSVHPNYARMHLTETSVQNPKEPPMFCMLLRKHLVGGFITGIEQVDMERIVHVKVRGKDEIGDETNKVLVIEIMGKHSNIILLDEENRILDSIKHLPPSQNSYRTVMPGHQYVAPPDQGKMNPLKMESLDFIKKIDFNSGKIDKQIVQLVMGFSPMIAREMTHQAHLGSNEKYQMVFESFQEKLKNHEYTPVIYRNNKERFYVFELEHFQAETDTYSSVSEMLDQFFAAKAERDRVKQQVSDLTKWLKNERDKNERKIKKHQDTLQKAKLADSYRHKGELLTANMHVVKKGDDSVKVIDYYDPDQKEIEIELDPNKSPSENAQKFFQTYQKLKKSKQVVQEEIKKAENEIQYFDQLLQQLETAREEDIEEIREELQEEGYLKKQRTAKKKRGKHLPNPEKYIASDGTVIYVGKNNKQNEYLTNRLANRNDIWLHAKDIPGSHVVIRSTKPAEDTLMEAAQLAAYFSKGKQSSSVPVDFTEVRHVKKPKGAKPGFVIYDHQKTLFVTPDEQVIRKLKLNREEESGHQM
ncbi:MAG: NFACT family protein [Bacillaceae bacterium]|nr:NFACT family protein [Bacillaceae bacterium]